MIQIVSRGLWPTNIITVHGPHEYPENYYWGSAECTRESDPDSIWEVKFQSQRSQLGKCKYGVRNIEMWVDGPLGEKPCPILKGPSFPCGRGGGLELDIVPLFVHYEEKKKGGFQRQVVGEGLAR
jgi:hypothetical protein